VITIDRMLPDIDGIAVMRQLRDDGVAAPVPARSEKLMIGCVACAPAKRRLAVSHVEHDVLDHDDGIVDDETGADRERQGQIDRPAVLQ
jgi:CheY-like chemotaxis protein